MLASLPWGGDVLVQVRSRAGGGWTVWWRGRRHFYSARLRAEGERRGGRIGRDPSVVLSRRGQRVRLRSDRVVEVYETLDGQVRSELVKR